MMSAISQEKQSRFDGIVPGEVARVSEDDLLLSIREALYRPWANALQLAGYCETAMPFFAGAVQCIQPPELFALQQDAGAWGATGRFLNHASADIKTTPFHGASETCWYGWIPSSGDRTENMRVPEKKFTHYIALGRFHVHQPLLMLTLSKGAGQSRLRQFFASKAAGTKLNDNTRKLLRIFLLVAQKHFGRELGIIYPGQSAGFAAEKIVLSEEQLARHCIGLRSAQLYRCRRCPEYPKKETTLPCSNEANPDSEGKLIFDQLD